jgi:hypothetical protein
MPARKREAAKSAKTEPVKSEEKKSSFDEPLETLDTSEKVNHNKNMGKSKGILILVLVLLVLAASGVAAYSYGQYQKSQEQIKSLKANPQEIAKAESKETVDAVGKLIALPKDETPTIATVTDAKKLKNQQFFAKAENGDKVLIYTQAKKAILYREKINKIIEVAPVNLGQQPSPTIQQGKVSPTPKSKVTTAPKTSPTEEP